MRDLIKEVDNFANAVAGQDGTKTAFAVACSLWRKCADEGTVEAAFNYYNSTKCNPPFAEKRIKRMITDAKRIVGSDVGKYERDLTAMTAATTATTVPTPTIRENVKPLNQTWELMTTRLLNKCQDDYSLTRDDHQWLEYTRGIDSIFAYGVGVGYCVGSKSGQDYKLSQTVFSTENEVSVYVGYTVPIHNEASQLVGLVFVRPTQKKQWRYMVLTGSQLLPFGIDWLRFGQDSPRVVVLVEGTMNYLSLLQSVGGHVFYDHKVVVLGLPNANVYPDFGTLSLLRKSDTVCLLTDNDEAGERCKERWGQAIESVGVNCVGIEYKKSQQKIDANDLLCNGQLWEWFGKIMNSLHKLGGL